MSGSIVLQTLGAARDLGRLHEIAAVLAKHGFADLVRRLGIASGVEQAGRLLHLEGMRGLADKGREESVREALEELGPTFVKVGQILAGRSDLLPPTWTRELARLHQSAAPVPIEEIRAQLVEDLSCPPEEVFEHFDPEPLAAASIAQVHRARLVSGEEVVLKVRRPGIRQKVEADVRLLGRLAELAERELPELARYRPRSLVRQATRSLLRELDLRYEARNARRLFDLCRDGGIAIPRVHDRWTRERLLVLDFLEGPSMGEWLASGEGSGADRVRAAREGADAVLEMVFVHGFFHADPHLGNVLVLEDGRLALVDFGMVGVLSDERRLEFLELLAGVSEGEVDRVVDVLLDWSHDGRVDEDVLREECAAFIERYRDLALRDLDTGALLADVTTLLRANDLFLPEDVALLLKVFVTLEGLGLELDPGFVMSRHIEPFAVQALVELRSPSAVARRGARLLTRILTRVPRDGRRFLKRLRSGRAGVDIDVPQLDHFSAVVSRSANRVTIGLVTSALIVGTAICTSVAEEPLPAWLGFASSVVVGAWLILSILRSGR